SRVSEIVRLNRGRPARQNPQSIALGVTVQVDQDVDALGLDSARRLVIAVMADVVKRIEGRLDPAADRTAIVAPVGESVNLEARPVVLFQKLDDQVRQRVLSEHLRK